MSNTTLTPEQIAEIRQRAERAVHGPWETLDEQFDRTIQVAHSTECDCFSADCGFNCHGGHVVIRIHDKSKHYNNRLHDAHNLAFIAASRTDVPAICNSHNAQAARIAELEAQLAQRDKALAEAPHGRDCRGCSVEWCAECESSELGHLDGKCLNKRYCVWTPKPIAPCDCWKSTLAALDQKEPGTRQQKENPPE